MSANIVQLEQKRNYLMKQLTMVGDFRRGTISVNYRKCGKPECRCAKDESQRHGPQYLWNATIGRKSVAKNLRLGPEVEKYINETEEYKKFMKLCEELVEVNEQICDAREIKQPESQEALEALKKKLRKQLMKRQTKK